MTREEADELLETLDAAANARESSMNGLSREIFSVVERETAWRDWLDARAAVENALDNALTPPPAPRVVADENAVVAFMNRERRDRGARTMSAEKEMLVRRAVRLAINGATNMTTAALADADAGGDDAKP
jgi:hypothetical protein